MRVAKDTRKIFCETLQSAIEDVMSDPRQVAGVYVQVHHEDGSILTFKRESPGINLLSVVGAFEQAKASVLRELEEG